MNLIRSSDVTNVFLSFFFSCSDDQIQTWRIYLVFVHRSGLSSPNPWNFLNVESLEVSLTLLSDFWKALKEEPPSPNTHTGCQGESAMNRGLELSVLPLRSLGKEGELEVGLLRANDPINHIYVKKPP